MVTRLSYPGILSTIGNTPLVELQNVSPKKSVRIYAKLEGNNPTGSIKDRIALRMIEAAESDGEISSKRTILEPTSGNTGIALAMIGRLKGYPVSVVMPENVSIARPQLLEAYGDDYLMMYQYGNQANPDAHYYGTGNEIVETIPNLDMLVAGLGTGGTLMGVARRIKEHKQEVKVVAVAPEPDDFISGLRSLEAGFIPPILDLNLLDSRMLVGSFDSFNATKELLVKEGIFAGVSSGSVVFAAIKQAERMEQGNLVCILADGGWKYLSTALWTKDYEKLAAESQGKIWW